MFSAVERWGLGSIWLINFFTNILYFLLEIFMIFHPGSGILLEVT